MEDFKKCTNTFFDGRRWNIECKLGIWCVSGTDKDEVQDEALSYFRQYLEDGEYYKILGGESPLDILIKSRR